MTEQQTNLFNKKVMEESLVLFHDFSDKCMSFALLQTFDVKKLDENKKQLIKQMKNDWMDEKMELKNRLTAKLDCLQMQAKNLNEYAFTD